MITDDVLVAAGAALHDRFGHQRAAEFGRALPDLVRRLTIRWDLQVDLLLVPGATSVVLAVRDRADRAAILKVSPDRLFLAEQVRMLEHLMPTGRVPVVVDSSEADGAVLLQRVLPGDTVDSDRGAPPTVRQWAALLSDLHQTSADGVPGRLADRCEEMIDRIGAWRDDPTVAPLVPDDRWQQTVDLCRQLTGTDQERVVIHGDLHLGNVLYGQDRRLIAIDPKLCVGDRCFDMVDFVAVADGPEQMTGRARELARLARMDPDRLLAWSAVNAVVTAVSRIFRAGSDQRTDALLTFADQAFPA